MTWEQTTRLVLFVVTVTLIFYDIAALYYGGSDATISRVFYRTSREHPWLAFALGLILGHVLWPN